MQKLRMKFSQSVNGCMANQLIIAGLHQLTVSGLIFGPLAVRIRTPDELKQFTKLPRDEVERKLKCKRAL
jgi:hypothetical protein